MTGSSLFPLTFNLTPVSPTVYPPKITSTGHKWDLQKPTLMLLQHFNKNSQHIRHPWLHSNAVQNFHWLLSVKCHNNSLLHIVVFFPAWMNLHSFRNAVNSNKIQVSLPWRADSGVAFNSLWGRAIVWNAVVISHNQILIFIYTHHLSLLYSCKLNWNL